MARIGIDFGTCFTSAAFIENGKPVAIRLTTGFGRGDHFSMPTCVFIEDTKILVGQVADNRRNLDTSRFKEHFKSDLINNVPYSFANKYFYHPKDLAKEILLHVKQQAMKRLDVEKIDHAVITYPANFSETYREALKEAAINAGFLTVDLLDEPTAAAIYYASKENIATGTKILVYDLGGGTFDVALIEKVGENYTLLTPSKGISNCGGKDFDDEIERDILRKNAELVRILSTLKQSEKKEDKKVLHLLKDKIREAALNVKIQLSEYEIGSAFIQTNVSYQPFEYELTKQEFEKLIEPYISETCNKIKEVIYHSALTPDQIDRVLLIGGSTRIPYVVQKIEETVGKKVKQDVDRDLAVCFGASLWSERQEKPVSEKPSPLSNIEIQSVIRQTEQKGKISTVEELLEAIHNAVGGDTIYVGEGSYELPGAIWLTQSVSLQGGGVEATRFIMSVDSGIYIDCDHYQGTISNIAFIHDEFRGEIKEKDTFIYSLKVLKGAPRIHQCIFKGEGDIEYIGVSFENNASGTVETCRFESLYYGIQATGSSTPLARENTCVKNLNAGIYIENAEPVIEKNTCMYNPSGIECTSNARGSILNNTCTENEVGINVMATAHPELMANNCQQNTNGIQYRGQSSGKAIHNHCNHNKRMGIMILDTAQPILENNVCEGNTRAGIYVDNVQPCINTTVFKNICAGNSAGIVISNNANPIIDGNLCSDNKQHGIEVILSGSGIIRQNDCTHNQLDGVYIAGKAFPHIENNVCQYNKRYGIGFFEQSQGRAQENHCSFNQMKDIFVTDIAEPVINYVPIKPGIIARLKYLSK